MKVLFGAKKKGKIPTPFKKGKIHDICACLHMYTVFEFLAQHVPQNLWKVHGSHFYLLECFFEAGRSCDQTFQNF